MSEGQAGSRELYVSTAEVPAVAMGHGDAFAVGALGPPLLPRRPPQVQWANTPRYSSGGGSSSSTPARPVPRSEGLAMPSMLSLLPSLPSSAATALLSAPVLALLAMGIGLRRRARRGRRSQSVGAVACRAARPRDDSEGDGVKVKDRTEDDGLGYVAPSREELQRQEIELLQATGALELQKKEEAFHERKKWRKQNPSPLDRWENEMDEVRNDTQRRMLWGDLKKKSGDVKRYRGKQVAEKEQEIKFNRGFPVEDTVEDEERDAEQDRQWLEQWRAAWPEGEALDPHDPESFGFGFVGEVTGAHGIHGEVRVRADDFLCDQGYDPAEHLSRRNYSNWTEDAKRVHLKSPNRRFPRPFRILTGKRVQRRVFALRLQGVETAEEAIALRGYKVFVLEPPPTAEQKAKFTEDYSGVDLYNADTTTFHTRDALELIGAKCCMVSGQAEGVELVPHSTAELAKVMEAGWQRFEFMGKPKELVKDGRRMLRYEYDASNCQGVVSKGLKGDSCEAPEDGKPLPLYERRHAITMTVTDEGAGAAGQKDPTFYLWLLDVSGPGGPQKKEWGDLLEAVTTVSDSFSLGSEASLEQQRTMDVTPEQLKALQEMQKAGTLPQDRGDLS
ncbi:unnamed protein product [Polarella glacialis]|uniref:Uncharacterized protein n=1 Tax=Polarella glacialis TaxID=89957 RepID=A0A813HPC9_POLGL|nr:unnamed protein product [Polarella glacialis]